MQEFANSIRNIRTNRKPLVFAFTFTIVRFLIFAALTGALPSDPPRRALFERALRFQFGRLNWIGFESGKGNLDFA